MNDKRKILDILSAHYRCPMTEEDKIEEKVKEAVTDSKSCRAYAIFSETSASVGCNVFNSSRVVLPIEVDYQEDEFLHVWLGAVARVQSEART